jgi:hypothetical protein
MRDAVEYARQHGGVLVRYPGGFWAKGGWRGCGCGVWFGTTTVNALLERGVAEVVEWKEGRSCRFPIKVKVRELTPQTTMPQNTPGSIGARGG